MIIVSCDFLRAQIIIRDEYVRFGAGISTLATNQIDNLINEIEKETAKLGPGVTVAPFNENLVIFLEYESVLAGDFLYQFYIQYTGNKIDAENTDVLNKIDQGLRFEYDIYQAGLTITYDLPIFKISTTQTSLRFGAGLDISFAEFESFYYFDQRPAFVQTLKTKRNSGIVGGRFFIAWHIPYVESLSLQLRVGYDLRATRKMPGETEEFTRENLTNDRDLMDPEVFDSFDSFNLSQMWVTFSMAYLF
jgi:hypothetical protein